MIYYKKGKVIVIGHVLNQFIYELSVNVFHKNYYFVANTKYFSSLINLPVVESYKVNKNIEISCYLHAAPIDWLINNTDWDDWENIAVKINDKVKVTDDDFWCSSDDFTIIDID